MHGVVAKVGWGGFGGYWLVALDWNAAWRPVDGCPYTQPDRPLVSSMHCTIIVFLLDGFRDQGQCVPPGSAYVL